MPNLSDDIYIVPPPGYTKASPGMVCKLRKSLYGLKQASREWNVELTTQLYSYGFTQSAHDHCLFTYTSIDNFVFLLVYVDDVLITGSSLDAIIRVKDYLHSLFTIKDLGDVKYFLGMEFTRSPSGVYITQSKYSKDLLRDSNMLDCVPAPTPFPPGLKFLSDDQDSSPLLDHPDQYRRLVGRLLYLNYSRPDLTYALQQLSQFVTCPRQSHWHAAMHVLRYLSMCPSRGLYYSSNTSL